MIGNFVPLLLTLQVHGAGACPSAKDVQTHLLPLLPRDVDAAGVDEAKLEEHADHSLEISLALSEGGTPFHKVLPASAPCAERAELAAVTLAIWEAQLHPEIALSVDPLSPDPAPSPAPAAVPDRVEPSAPPADGRELVLGVGLSGVSLASAPAPGGSVILTMRGAGSPWGAHLAGVVVGSRTVALPPGEASYWRSYGMLGADLALWRSAGWSLQLQAGAAIGAVRIEGHGYPTNRSDWNVDLGVDAGFRFGSRDGRLRPWLGADLVTWLRRQQLDVVGAPADQALPRFDWALTLGVDFLLGG